MSKERHVSQLEKYIEVAEPDDEMLSEVMLMTGEAYMKGEYGAPVDMEKAKKYYKMAADKNDPRGQFMMSRFYCFPDEESEDEEQVNMDRGIGIMYLCKSHLNGYQMATNMLNDMIRNGMIEAKSIDDLLKIAGMK